MEIKESSEVYDVIIVGSGAGGGMAGYILAKAGVKVLMLEAGPFFDPAKDSLQLKWAWQMPGRGAPITRPFYNFLGSYDGWQIDGEPYTHADGTSFDWFRSHMLGGRTNHWGRISLRMGPRDFKGGSYDGATDDWPISYDDIAPYYDKVDRMIGVYGTKEGLEQDPDGLFLPPAKMSLNDLYLKKGAQKVGINMIPGRGAVLTAPLKGNTDRKACFFCGQCDRSCKIYGDFSSSSCLVIPAMKTGNLKLIPNAMVREVLVDPNGLAKGVSYIDKGNSNEYRVKGKIVVLAASACSTARIMLNSRSDAHPDGLANSSGVVGRYLHDSTGSSMGGFLPQLLDRKRYNEDGVGSSEIYAPWWLYDKKLDFPRGYHIECGGKMYMPLYGYQWGIEQRNSKVPGRDGKSREAGGFGTALKADYRRFFGTGIGMAGRGMAIARKSNYCEIDPQVVDKYGIPVLRFHYKWSDWEIKQAKHMQETFASIFHAMGAVITSKAKGKEDNYGLSAPGYIIHEVGTVRMGDDPKTSALNKWCQAHDCKNLFVTDGGPFVQQGNKNPTWTILALSMRTAEYILDQKQKMNI